MIDYISGSLTELEPATAIIETHGIGFELNITLIDYPHLQQSDKAKLYVHEVIREDTHTLYGFISREERALFRLLIGVSGVGPNTARLILSAFTVTEFESIIATDDERQLKGVKGVGGKTAQRIIIDLKDKINITEASLIEKPKANSAVMEEALAALITLGFTQQQSVKALKKIIADFPSVSLENAIKMALKML